ncbi:MAG: class I SAM-dependent methyltransferase family protein [Candidatus Binatia bacterium]
MPLLGSKGLVRFLAHYSEGLRLVVDHGPKSGVVFEYACRNEPRGSGPFGRWVDRQFLRSSLWQGLRKRTETTKAIVAEIVARRRAAGLTTMILDIASGTAPYLRELARERGGDDLVIAAHDRDPRYVVLGRELVAVEKLPNFTFAVGDATDEASYLTSHDPDIILAVGVFQLLQRDEAVRTVMRLAFAYLSPGGCFVCTTLAKPNVREIDSFGSSRAIRSAETIATWLREAGFTDIDQRFSQPQSLALIAWKPQES